MTETYDLRIVAEPVVIDAVADFLQREGHLAVRAEVVDASNLGLDFTTVAELATVLNATLLNDVALALALWFRPKAKARRIIVETPLGRVTMNTRDSLTDDEVRERLEAIVRVL